MRPQRDESDSAFSPYQVLVVGLCALVAMLDGFDTQAIAFVAPVIAKAWGVPVSGFGPAFAIGLFTGILGSAAFGVIADRRGRRLTILVTTAMFAAGAFATLMSKTMADLTLYRALTGFGLGGAIPSIVALSAEFSPPRLRATTVTAMFCGIPLGAVVGAAASVPLIQHWGWPAVFLAGGAAPLLLLPVLAAWLPESISWLRDHGRGDRAEATRAKTRLPSFADRSAEPAERPGLTALLLSGRALATLSLWCAFFLSLLLVFFLVSWIPAIAVAQTHKPALGAAAAAVFNLSAVAGALVLGRLVDRFGAVRIVGAAYVAAAVGVMLIGLGPDARASVFVFSVFSGFFGMGAQLCLVAVAADFYSPGLRATGVGAAMGAGRLGAIAGSLAGGVLLGGAGAAQFPPVLCVLALMACVALAAAAALKRRERSIGMPGLAEEAAAASPSA